jgi:hypothetical protein
MIVCACSCWARAGPARIVGDIGGFITGTCFGGYGVMEMGT